MLLPLTRTLQGKNAALRNLKKGDAKELLQLAIENRNAVKNFNFFTEIEGEKPNRLGKYNLASEAEYIMRMALSDTDLLVAVEAPRGNLIGTCGLHEIDVHNDTARLGILIFDESQWGKGYAREALILLIEYAFSELNIHKIYLNAFATNTRGLGLYKKLGFREEGRLREEYKIRGRYVNLVRMGLLKEEWSPHKILQD